jgi:hypothetical protein
MTDADLKRLNLTADTVLKAAQGRWEPWKAVAALVSAAAAFMAAGAAIYAIGQHNGERNPVAIHSAPPPAR